MAIDNEPTAESMSTLKPPVVRPLSPVLIRDDTSLQRVKNQQNIKMADISRYVESPKYMHIRVPRRDMAVTHVSQESFDSPFMLPKIDKSHHHGHHCQKRKPITVSLSQDLTLAKASIRRKKWKFRSTNEPLSFYTAPQSASSRSTKGTEESKESKTTSTDFSSVTSMSLEDLRTRSLKEILCNSKSESNIAHLNKAVKSVLSKSMYSKPYGANKENVGYNYNVIDSKLGSTRKKWILPDHWPNQNVTNGKCKMKY
jgi:hypothetical protein